MLRQNAPCRTGILAASSSPSPHTPTEPTWSLRTLTLILLFSYFLFENFILAYDTSWTFPILLCPTVLLFLFYQFIPSPVINHCKITFSNLCLQFHCVLQHLFSAWGHIYCLLFFFPIFRDFTSGPQTYASLPWFFWNVNTPDPFFWP